MVQHEQIDGDLPWGWWLRANGGVLEDDKGRKWHTVREAFWQGKLHYPETHVAGEQHELLLRVLSAMHIGRVSARERKEDLFDGNMLFRRFYMCWLASIGLLDMIDDLGRPVGPLDAPLNAEGRSVMLMLQATREPEWEVLPMSDIIEAIATSDRGAADDARERALNSFERDVRRRRHVFARERVGGLHLITLTGIGTGVGVRMPVRRVMWSQSFTDERARDDLFAWLAVRVDRWDDLGAMAYRMGASELTQHIFKLFIIGSAQQP